MANSNRHGTLSTDYCFVVRTELLGDVSNNFGINVTVNDDFEP